MLCIQRIKKRPLSPDVVGLDGKSAHYAFPLGAISSITNRVTGTILAVGESKRTGSRIWQYALGKHPSALAPLQTMFPCTDAGFIGAGYISLTGNLPALVTKVAATSPILLFPFKFAIAYVLFYHYLGAIRHYVWDHHKIGNQADKSSLLELDKVELTSKVLFGAAGVLALITAFM